MYDVAQNIVIIAIFEMKLIDKNAANLLTLNTRKVSY